MVKREDMLEMYEDNQGLVGHIVNRWTLYGEDKQDALQVGRIALWNACHSFNTTKNVPFASYACSCINGRLKHWYSIKRPMIKIHDGVLKEDRPVVDCFSDLPDYKEELLGVSTIDVQSIAEDNAEKEHIKRMIVDVYNNTMCCSKTKNHCAEQIASVILDGKTLSDAAREAGMSEQLLNYHYKKVCSRLKEVCLESGLC